MMTINARFRTFAREARGSITIFSIFIFVLILMISGMAVDMMQHESRRVKLQTVLDSAVIAAASENQTRPPKEVIEEYLEVSGLDSTNVTIGSTRIDGVSTATVSASVQTDTMFMNMMGIDYLATPSQSDAIERVTKIEISLVLDFTSSMKNGGRYDALISAVDDFVNVVYQLDCSTGTCTEPDPDIEIIVNVVPYGGTVNPGPTMAALMGLERWHGYSSCAEMPSGAWDDTTLPTGSSTQLPHFYIWNTRGQGGDVQEFGWCPQDDNGILYSATHPADIKAYVRTLELNDGTGSDIGMKWGMALLDPSSRDEINVINDTPTGAFPEEYDPSILKVAVLMTDGGITFQSHPTIHDYDWLYDAQVQEQKPDDLSVYEYDYEWYYDPTLTDPFVTERIAMLDRFGSLEQDDAGALDLDEDGNVQYRDRADIEYDVGGTTEKAWRNNHKVTKNDAIDNLEEQCGLAKVQKSDSEPRVSVYTVQFMASNAWITDYMRPCASNEGQYFFVNSNQDLSGVFASIANHINNRKLSLSN